mgnify:CR=1 FL=1
MNTLSYKTVSANKATVQKEWYVVDAKDEVLGRLASVVAMVLRGKHKPSFTPHVDCGDNVIVINADKIVLTGRKWDQKTYYRHSGYMGGLKSITAKNLLAKRPEDLVRNAVRGMLPKNRLGRKIFKNLKVYAGDTHPHDAQQPKVLDIK